MVTSKRILYGVFVLVLVGPKVSPGSETGTPTIREEDAEAQRRAAEESARNAQAQGASDNMNSNANQAKTTETLGAAGNAATGTLLVQQGTVLEGKEETRTQGIIMVAMGVLSLTQAAVTIAGAFASEDVADATNAYSAPTDSFDGTSPMSLTKAKSEYDKLAVNQKLKSLAARGYKFNPKTGQVTTPLGPMEAESIASPASMAAAGLSPSQIASVGATVEEAVRQAADRYHVSSMGTDSGGGGYTPSKSSSGSEIKPYFNPSSYFLDKARKPASVEGLHRLAGGELIGVKSDDIFQIVHRYYQARRKANMFIETEDPEKKSTPQH